MMAAPCIYLWVDVYVFAIIFIIQTLNQPVTHTSFTPTLQGLKQKKTWNFEAWLWDRSKGVKCLNKIFSKKLQ